MYSLCLVASTSTPKTAYALKSYASMVSFRYYFYFSILIVVLNLIGLENAEAGNIIVPNTMIVNFSTYENVSLGIKIQYPAHWAIDEFSDGVRFYDQIDPKMYEIAIYRYLSPSTSLDEEAAAWINYYKQNLTNFKLLDSGSSILRNASVYKISGTFDNKTKFKGLEFLSINGDDVYQIIYTAEIGVYGKWLKTAKNMMESLELSSANSVNSSYRTPEFSEGSPTEVPVPISVNPLTNMIYTLSDFSTGIDVSTIYNSEIQLLDLQPITINEPSGIAIDIVGTSDIYQAPYGLVFVTNKSGDIYIIDGEYNQVIGNITVGNQPNRIAVNPITNRIYVADCDSSNPQDQTISLICVIDYWTNYENLSHPYFFSEMTASIKLDGDINDISVNPQTNMVYVSRVPSDNIAVINGSSNLLINNITVGNQPNQMAVNPQTNMIYVSRVPSDNIAVINGSSNLLISNIQVDPVPRDIAVDPTTNRIYVASFSDNSTISTINGSSSEVIDKVSIARPVALEIDPTNKFLFVRHYDYPDISALDTSTGRIVEDVRSKRDIAFWTEPQSGGNIACDWKDGSYYSNYDPDNRFRLENDTEIACAAYSNWNYLFHNWQSNYDTVGNSTELRLKLTNQTMIVAYFNQLIPSEWLELAALLAAAGIAIHIIHSRVILYREKKINFKKREIE